VPTVTGVVLLDRSANWAVAHSLTDHKVEALAVDWAASGAHLVSIHTDHSAVVWDVEKRESLDRRVHSSALAAVAWAQTPTANLIALADQRGFFALWDNVLPKASLLEANKTLGELKPDEYERKKKAISALFDAEPLATPTPTPTATATTTTTTTASSDAEKRLKLYVLCSLSEGFSTNSPSPLSPT